MADPAFYSKKLRTKAYRAGFLPMIKEEKTAILGRKLLYEFDERIYTFRKVIEGIFGSTSIRYGNKTRCILEEHRRKWIILMSVAHNLREWMCVEALPYSDYRKKFILHKAQIIREQYRSGGVNAIHKRFSPHQAHPSSRHKPAWSLALGMRNTTYFLIRNLIVFWLLQLFSHKNL